MANGHHININKCHSRFIQITPSFPIGHFCKFFLRWRAVSSSITWHILCGTWFDKTPLYCGVPELHSSKYMPYSSLIHFSEQPYTVTYKDSTNKHFHPAKTLSDSSVVVPKAPNTTKVQVDYMPYIKGELAYSPSVLLSQSIMYF